ncbi:MAG: AraC family transcriptional regulator [Pseudomonadota bacterium]
MQPTSRWTYRRLQSDVGVEISDWAGAASPSLAPHFHDETQISAVFTGYRLFQIGQQVFRVMAGEFAIIPAATPHCSRGAKHVPTRSRDMFVDPVRCPVERSATVLIGSFPNGTATPDDTAMDAVLRAASSSGLRRYTLSLGSSLPDELCEAVRNSDMSIGRIADLSPLSREGFIRRFTREMGMTPHAWRLASKATRARAYLRLSLPPAATAHECGFADQSHLGRIFRKNFGTTPAAYRKVWQG